MDPLQAGASSRKFKDNYSVDDEDSPSNSNQVNSLHRNKVPPDKSGQYENNAVDSMPLRNSKYNSQLSVQKDFNRTSLRLEDLDFVPSCDIGLKEAVSAIHRARTQKCKRELANITCLIQQGKLYPTHLPNFCLASGKFIMLTNNSRTSLNVRHWVIEKKGDDNKHILLLR